MGLFVNCLVVVYVTGIGQNTTLHNGTDIGSLTNATGDLYLPCKEWISCYQTKLWNTLVAFVIGVLSLPLLFWICGFTCSGIRGDSLASSYQSEYGTDPFFSSAQSTGAKGGLGFALVGGIGAALVYWLLLSSGCDMHDDEPQIIVKLLNETSKLQQ